MMTVIFIVAAVTIGVWTYDKTLRSPGTRKASQNMRVAMAADPSYAGRSAEYIGRVEAVARHLWCGILGLVVGLAILGLGAVFGAIPARAEPAPCMSASLQMAFTRAPGIQVQRITREGTNPAAVVETFLANAGAPDLNTDDFILAADAEKVVVTPVRAGQVCRNFQRIAIPLASGGQALLQAIELAAMGAGRA